MAEMQLTMFDEVVHPLLKDLKCDSCGSKDVKITGTHCDKEISVEGCYVCNVCKCGESFLINKLKEN